MAMYLRTVGAFGACTRKWTEVALTFDSVRFVTLHDSQSEIWDNVAMQTAVVFMRTSEYS